MPKLKTEPIDRKSIEQYLAEEDDFAFEVKCLRELRKRAVKVGHAGTYSDPVTNKNRQFDFRVEVDHGYARIALAVESKNLKPNFPLIISRLERLPEEAFHQILIPSAEEEVEDGPFGISRVSSLKTIFPSESMDVKTPNSLYELKEMVGKSTVQVGRMISGDLHGDDSEVYEKWAQAVGSAYGLISDAAHSFADSESKVKAYYFLPVVVVPDQMLWIVDYSSQGEILDGPKKVDETTFFLAYSPWKMGQLFSYNISHLHFVTLTGLGSLVDRLIVNERYVKRIFSITPEIEDQEGGEIK